MGLCLSRRSLRIAPTIGVMLAAILATATPAHACYTWYDDGVGNTIADLDFTDDVTIKRIFVTAPSPVGLAFLDIFAEAYSCPDNGLRNQFLVNGKARNFNPCQEWSSGMGWHRTYFDPIYLVPGENIFQITDIDGTWATGINFAVDTNNDYGRSTIVVNGADRSGELMWRLESPGLIC